MAATCAYCNFSDRCTAEGVLRGLIHQLLARHPDLLPHVKQHYHEHRLQKTDLMFDKIVEILHSLVSSLDAAHIVIDGLDEIGDDKERMLLLKELEKLPARVLIFSRSLAIHLKHLPSAIVFPIDAKDEDIESFVVSSLLNHQSLQGFIHGAEDSLVREFATKIRDKCHGM